MKTAIVILSNPASDSEEALGRLFNALASAYTATEAGDEVQILFQGTGSRWPEVLNQPTHPAYDLFQKLRPVVLGVSRGCADIFGATESVKEAKVALLDEAQVPGTAGVANLRRLASEGYSILTF